jgi:hypothetical protein
MKLYNTKLYDDCIKHSFNEICYVVPDKMVTEAIEKFKVFNPKHIFTNQPHYGKTFIVVLFN